MNQDAFARIAESLRQYQMGCLDECPGSKDGLKRRHRADRRHALILFSFNEWYLENGCGTCYLHFGVDFIEVKK